jgi:Reverse transcriptase (RNA-dependent DNA polymerase)
MIKKLPACAKSKLLETYNNVWATHEFPESWTEALVIPILKKGKDPTNATSYRPISLTSCVCKVMEKLINRRLVFVLESKQLIPDQQYGFKKERSTKDVLKILTTDIIETFRERKHLVLTSLDISKAYDTCWRYRIIKTLKDARIDGKMLHFIINFMNNRSFRVAVGNTLSDPMTIENGEIQGAVLTVTLFLVAMSGITKKSNHP